MAAAVAPHPEMARALQPRKWSLSHSLWAWRHVKDPRHDLCRPAAPRGRVGRHALNAARGTYEVKLPTLGRCAAQRPDEE